MVGVSVKTLYLMFIEVITFRLGGGERIQNKQFVFLVKLHQNKGCRTINLKSFMELFLYI